MHLAYSRFGVEGRDPQRLPIASCTDVCDYPAYSPDGTQLAFSVIETKPDVDPAAGSIRVVDLDGSNERVLARTSRPEVLDNPRWSPDGKRLSSRSTGRCRRDEIGR
jgi:Tol biopolymer transport system component